VKKKTFKCCVHCVTTLKLLLKSSKLKKEKMAQNNYKGFSLFNDIEDAALRNRNRAVVLANIAEDNMDKKTKRVNLKGASLILHYFKEVMDADKADVEQRFAENMRSRGFILSAN
jgi:hypothetical protein